MPAKLDDVGPLAEELLRQHRGRYGRVADEIAARTGLRVSQRTVRRWAKDRGLAPRAPQSPPKPTSESELDPAPVTLIEGVSFEVDESDPVGTIIRGLVALGADPTVAPSVRVSALDKAGYFAFLQSGGLPKRR